jgi:D-alanine-D-alanine ligase
VRIGLTYDLRAEYLAAGYSEEETAEFDRPDTIDAIEAALWELGHQTDRIGRGQNLVNRLAAGDRWDLVFNIAEGLHGRAREAQVPALLDLYQIPYTFSDPLVLALALHKELTKTVVRQAGVPTADSVLVEVAEDVGRVDLPLPLFAKPVAEGTSKGVSAASRIVERAALRQVCRELLDRFRQPVLVETFLPGREFTVGVLGTGAKAQVLGTLEVVLRPHAEAAAYSYLNKEQCEELVEYRLCLPQRDSQVQAAEKLALQVWRLLGCRDGGRVDFRCDAQGRPNFLEVNPLPGLHPHHSDLPILCTQLGIPYVELIRRILESALARVNGEGRLVCVAHDEPAPSCRTAQS